MTTNGYDTNNDNINYWKNKCDLWGNHELEHELSVISMNSSPWQQSYNQQPYLSGGSPLLPPSSHEDPLNNFAGGNANSFLSTSAPCQDLQSSIPNADLLANVCYESLLSPAIHSSKETAKYYNDDVFNGVCKENQTGMQNFLQCSESRNEGSFPNTNYPGQVPSISFNSSANLDQPSPSPFGVLPHLAVKPVVSRGHETFVTPVSKTVSAYNNGPYTERENNSILHNNPLSNSSSFSADTATPSPAALNSLSSNFSSPSNDYATFSPQTMGAYNKPVHSPMPQSPSVALHSYPSSPYTNIDSVGHISTAPPCSPMNGGTYVNNLNGVPVRNGLHKQQQQLSSSNNSAISNNACYTPQSHVGPITGLSKTPDYHPDYNVYAPDRISPSSYSSGYSSMHSSRMSNDSRMSLSPRGNSNIPHEAQMRYGHHRSVPSATVSSPTYLPNNAGGHDIQYPPSNMQPPSYMPSIRNHSYPGPSSMVTSNVSEDPYAFPPSEMVDDKGALDMFNCHVELGNQAPVPYSNYPDSDIQILNADSNRMLRSSKPGDSHLGRSMHYANVNKSLVQQPMMYKNEPMQTDRQSAMPSYYNPAELGRMENPMFDTPKRRGGRRGRRRGGNMGCRGRGRRGTSWRNEDRNVYYYDASYARMNEYNAYQQFKREPDSTPYVNASEGTARVMRGTAGYPNDNQSNTNSNGPIIRQRFPHPHGMNEIRQEMSPLVLYYHPRRRNLRSCTKRDTKFLLDFVYFTSKRPKPRPGSIFPKKKQVPKTQEPERPRSKHKTKQSKKENYGGIKIRLTRRLDPSSRDTWLCTRGTSESPLTLSSDEEKDDTEESTSVVSSPVLLSSHKIKQEVESEVEDSPETETGNFGQVTGKRSAETKTNCKTVGRHPLNVTNSETLPAGKAKVKPENASPAKNPAGKEQPTEAKKLGKKNKSQPTEDTESNTQTGNSTLNGQDPTSNSSVLKSDEMHASEERLGVLRSSNSSTKEPKPGPSNQVDLVDDVSDHFDNYENFDDSDSDPAWTPTAKEKNKASDTAKAYGGSGRKRGAKTGRKPAANSNPAKKRKAAAPPPEPRPKKKRQTKPKPAPVVPKPTETRSRGRKDTGTDRFLIAKADINLPTPFIWKVDRKSSMLQRFEISEQNGVLLYQSSFTYAAGNQFCVSKYVTADVKVLSPDTVQYLGPNLSETAEVALSELRQGQTQDNSSVEENFDYLKEDFTVYIQSLLSQDVDSSFLHEIKKFNDEYFLIPIQTLEAISEGKKEKLLNEFWSEELKKSIHTYPHFNILDSGIDNINCKACGRTQGSKMLQFYGEAYDSVTLEHVDSPPPVAKTQFSVCDNCSISISLYSRLHHHKYNLFVECHSKASEVKANNDNVQSHEDVLKLCLEDTVWIEKIFAEQVQIWRDCKKDS